jgi:hypothetical protein
MQDQDVAVGVVQEAHQAHAGVDRGAEEVDPRRLEAGPGLRHVVDAERDPAVLAATARPGSPVARARA